MMLHANAGQGCHMTRRKTIRTIPQFTSTAVGAECDSRSNITRMAMRSNEDA